MRLALAISTLAALFLCESAIAQSTTCKGVPALTVIAKNGERSTLIGSYHVAAAGLRQPAKSVMDGATRYVVEHTGPSEMPPARTQRADWSKSLSEEQITVLRQRVGCTHGFSIDSAKLTEDILSFESAEYASSYAISHCAPPKLLSRDKILLSAANERGLRSWVLEANEQVEKQRRDVPEHIYRHTFYTAFTPASEQGQRRAIDALNSGNYDEITSALRDLAANQNDADTFRRVMITERNRAWMPNLMRYLDDGKAFVNVGGAHLPGPDGLIQLLRDNGYIVEATCLQAEAAVDYWAKWPISRGLSFAPTSASSCRVRSISQRS